MAKVGAVSSRIVPIVGLLAALMVLGCPPRTQTHEGFTLTSSQRGGAPWTILCLELCDADRQDQITRIAQTLKATPGIRPQEVYAINHPDGCSRLYYGTYKLVTDRRTGQREISSQLRADLDLIRQLGVSDAGYFFRHARKVRKPTPDVGDVRWLLSRADGVYSLQVAAFIPTDDFADYKQAAWEYCSYLRSQGHQAWYLHSDTGSIVTVGSFGSDAIRTQRIPGQFGYVEQTLYSDEVLALQRNELFRYNVVNGAIYRTHSEGGTAKSAPSFLVKVPGAGEHSP